MCAGLFVFDLISDKGGLHFFMPSGTADQGVETVNLKWKYAIPESEVRIWKF